MSTGSSSGKPHKQRAKVLPATGLSSILGHLAGGSRPQAAKLAIAPGTKASSGLRFASSVGVSLAGNGVLVGGTSVSFGGTGVAVGETGFAVGGSDVKVEIGVGIGAVFGGRTVGDCCLVGA